MYVVWSKRMCMPYLNFYLSSLFLSLSLPPLLVYLCLLLLPMYPSTLTSSLLYPSLNDLEHFIKLASGGLYVSVEEGDYDGLVGVMGHLMQVKNRQPAADHMFEPLKETIELLTTYGQELSDAVHQQLQVCVLARTVK